jgi:ADP-heptose:LPS heptosyltransferase
MTTTLVVHSGGIGDLILCAPSISWLASAGSVDIVGERGRAELLVAGGDVRAAYALDDVDFSSVFSSPSERLRAFLQSYDRAVVWFRDTGEIMSAFQSAGVGDVQCFAGIPDERWTRHASEYYLDYLGAPTQEAVRLSFPAQERSYDIVIHPGSGGTQKNWPCENFVALSEALRQEGREVAWCLGPAEEGVEVPPGVERLQCVSLVELGACLANTQLYIGNDSGITHLAAAVGCETVALFGPTEPTVWAPLGENVRLACGAQWPTLEQVLGIVTCRKFE